MYEQFGYPGMNYGGYGYGYAQQQPQQPPVFNQLLTPDEVMKLQKTPQAFSTKLTEDEYLRSMCTHKNNQNGQFTLEKLPNGKHRCAICQAEFTLIDVNSSKEDIESICATFYDLLQTIKTYYGNAPATLRDFYLMAGFIKKIPQLWITARNYFDKATNQYGLLQPNNEQSGFAVLSNIFGNGAMGGVNPGMGSYYGGYGYPPAYQQPQAYPQGYNPQQQQVNNPQAPQQPMPQQPMPQPQAYPQQNGFNPAFPYQPSPVMSQQNGYGYNQAGFTAPNPAMQGINPIGYVENNGQKDFTANQPGPAVNSGTQAQPNLPEPPKNPNVVDNNKAVVGKNFAG